MDKKRFYSFICVIYDDDENFENQMFNLLQEKDVIYIKHDRDVNEETGELKKPHYHFVIKLKNACTISALANRVGVGENMVEPIKKNVNAAMRYLIHDKCENKFQYDVKDVKSNSDKLLRKFQDLILDETPETDKIITIQDYIDSFDGQYVKLSLLAKHVQKINMWDAYRRNYSIIKDLVSEHNAMVNVIRYNIRQGIP